MRAVRRTQVILIQLDFVHERRHHKGESLPVEVVKSVADKHGQEYSCPVVSIACPGHGCSCGPFKGSQEPAWSTWSALRGTATFASGAPAGACGECRPGGGDAAFSATIDHRSRSFTTTMEMSSWSLCARFCGLWCVCVNVRRLWGMLSYLVWLMIDWGASSNHCSLFVTHSVLQNRQLNKWVQNGDSSDVVWRKTLKSMIAASKRADLTSYIRICRLICGKQQVTRVLGKDLLQANCAGALSVASSDSVSYSRVTARLLLRTRKCNGNVFFVGVAG